jgi:hypothetical protein
MYVYECVRIHDVYEHVDILRVCVCVCYRDTLSSRSLRATPRAKIWAAMEDS